MIRQYLENHYNIGRLHNSYLINTDDLDKGFSELKDFISTKILNGDPVENSADYICVQKLDSKTKGISVDQIREMQKFLYKTSVITGKKLAVIYAADQMNLNAANCCLKVLEDTPPNTHLFLLTDKAASILPTIRSRCAKVNHHYHLTKEAFTNPQFLSPLLKRTTVSEKLKFIADFGSKDRDLWQEFAIAAQELIAKFCKKSISLSCNLSEQENEIFLQFKSHSPQYLQVKYDQVREIVDNTNIFDLDLRASCILLIDKFRN
ncbi:MAG: DNA polymerase III subunit delta' [Rickettsiaceae bacterium]